MIPVLFLYNLDNPRGAKIRRTCLPLGIRTKLVPPQAHTLTLEELTAAPRLWTAVHRAFPTSFC